jgi:hypothetical protein
MATQMMTDAKIVHCVSDFKGAGRSQVWCMIRKSGNRFVGKDHAQEIKPTGLIQQSWIRP